ncbi:hypothetical protein M514_24522 [Trichuris suis]|uniref:DDE-1 domain-containing protein n=1 Tax=Trichuris suis TaxID=68888 RepID=A0A085N1J6_9BILA|nr:hypothetical protein M514_24522 [Trichuris suis]
MKNVLTYKNAERRLNEESTIGPGRPPTIEPRKAMANAIKASVVVEHASQCSIDPRPKIICRESLFHLRRIKEALYIKSNSTINRDNGVGTHSKRGSASAKLPMFANDYTNESFNSAASADKEAAAAYPPALKKLIDERGYSSQQILNVDETGLFWKRMSKRTYIAQEEKSASGFKPAKDHPLAWRKCFRRSEAQAHGRSDGRHTLEEFWRGYHIMNAIENLAAAWHEVKGSTMILAWRKICPEAIAELTVLEQRLQNVHRELGELVHKVGFSDINEEDTLELLESHDEELSKKDLMEMEQQFAE